MTGTGTGEVTVETLQRLVDAFNAHDLDAVMSFFADDAVLEMPRGPHPWGRRLQGREEVRSGLASRFAGIPDVHYGEDRHRGPSLGQRRPGLLGVAAHRDDHPGGAGRGARLRPVRVRGDKITRKDSYWKLVER